VAALALAAPVALGLATATVPATANVPLSIAIDGNHFVNGAGQTVRLLGVDQPGTEYACYYGYDPGESVADAAAIAAWHANAVRIPLNEDCWLGINNEPQAPITTADYQQAIKDYVADLNADGIYAILDLHWSAPGTVVADGQRPMPDDHSAAFWTSVANTFLNNHAVVFDAFNEPYSPAADGYTNYPVSWSCWQNGGCTVPDAADGTTPDPSKTYKAVGMQALVSAIRATGATQPIMLGGLAYANDLSGWLANEPADTLNAPQLAASFHNYEGEACDDAPCWNNLIAPVAAKVPVVTGEFDEDTCPATTPDGFDDSFMDWADANGVSYLAWGWWVLSPLPDCSNYYVISDAAGTPAAPNGTALYDHLAALAQQTTTTTTTRTTAPPPPPTTTTATTATTTTTTMTTPPTGGSQALRHEIQASLGALLKFERSRSLSDLLRGRAVVLRFHAPAAGLLNVRLWKPATRRTRTIVVATAAMTFRRAGTSAVKLRLTKAGRRLLEHDRRVSLHVQTSFAQRGGPTETESS
jgi:hypothetical protein